MKDKDKRLVSRGGLKLEAALDHFQLAPLIRGAHAVDVGASTGGFTQVLLDKGATEVVCVDVGHGQLHERLRRDPRVRNLENADWKHLSLSEAPGPFDFFTVDVSFVAARNMLRGLAFRLRPGAQGVVLVKPQFELPDHLVRQGDVSDPALRRKALESFVKKAEGLGFRMIAHVDSPVAGGEGTIEILTHLIFDGRSEKLPQPGEKRPAPTPSPSAARKKKATAAAALAGTLDWFAVAAPGTEEVAAREAFRLLPGCGASAVAGGVELRGSLETAMRANLHLRIPTRLLLRLGTIRAREFGKMRHLLARLPWSSFLPAGASVKITVSASHCRLYHTGAIEEAVRAAMGDEMGAAPPKPPAAAPGEPAVAAGGGLVLVRGVDDSWTISVDSSGERLHRRGWRTEGGEAPLRESLAAALLALAEWNPAEALVDPMCGAGTIPIEACTTALNIAPGLRRSFAFETWPLCDRPTLERWAAFRAEAEAARRRDLPAPIFASDRDPAAVSATRHNAARAGVDQQLTVAERALVDVQAPASTGLFIANPPYGERLGARKELPRLYRDIGQLVRQRFGGWRSAIVVPDARLASAFRLPLQASHAFIHGGLRVTVLRFGPAAERLRRSRED
ncbi:MAG: SAM-dependent methyltransferase [Myxococcales bacterium]